MVPATRNVAMSPSTTAAARRPSSASASAAAPVAGGDPRPAEGEPGGARDDDRGQLEQAVGEDQPEEARAVAGRDHPRRRLPERRRRWTPGRSTPGSTPNSPRAKAMNDTRMLFVVTWVKNTTDGWSE